MPWSICKSVNLIGTHIVDYSPKDHYCAAVAKSTNLIGSPIVDSSPIDRDRAAIAKFMNVIGSHIVDYLPIDHDRLLLNQLDYQLSFSLSDSQRCFASLIV